jgi:hypothetical protein
MLKEYLVELFLFVKRLVQVLPAYVFVVRVGIPPEKVRQVASVRVDIQFFGILVGSERRTIGCYQVGKGAWQESGQFYAIPIIQRRYTLTLRF